MNDSERPGIGERILRRLPLLADRPLTGIAIAIALVALAFALRWALGDGLPPGFPYLTFFPAVILSAFLFGLRPGLVAAILALPLAWYFFISPGRFSFAPAHLLAVGFYLFIVGINLIVIDALQRAGNRLRIEQARSERLAETRALLFQELQHRVSNNLQVVAALLTLQRRELADAGARDALDEASRRLALIGRSQRQLYDPDGGQLPARQFLEQIGRDAMAAAGMDCTLTVEAGDTRFAPAVAVPVALIVAEAIANAIEHGFKAQPACRIEIALRQDSAGGGVLSIADDGAGLPDGFVLDGATSLGLKIALTLARQIGGRFELIGGDGTTARLELPATAFA